MKRFLFTICLIAVLLSACQPAVTGQAAPETPPVNVSAEVMPEYGEITGQQLEELAQSGGVTIIDVRTAEEYAQGHVAGAINIPVDRFQTEFSDLGLSPDQPIALYCRTTNRSQLAYQILLKEGFDKLFHAPGVALYDYPLVK